MQINLVVKRSFVALSLMLLTLPALSDITLPSIFGNHMVMQQHSEVKLWGWGKPLENVAVKPSWSNDTIKTTVNNFGRWSVMINTPKAGGSHEIEIKGNNTVTIEDILMGDVWLLSGQSNMEWSVEHGIDRGEEAAMNAQNNDIRLFHVVWITSNNKCIDVKGEWKKCIPETMRPFSALGYFFGEELNKVLKQPIGLISSHWGGTPIEAWILEDYIYQSNKLTEAANKIPYFPWAPNKPGITYNAMIHPIMPFKIKGALWYQGEANVENAYAYVELLELLVSSWRQGFNTDFDFYYAQIAPYMHYAENAGAKVRDAQRRALAKIDKSGMVVLSDIGDTLDIHPRNKIDAGKRLAHLALNKTYGKENYAVSGPLFKDYLIDKDKVEVSFDFNDGLYAKDGKLEWFELAGEDLEWHKADAIIKGGKVIVSSSKVKKPIHVRYAWGNAALPNLYNSDNLPTSCFTSYDWLTEDAAPPTFN